MRYLPSFKIQNLSVLNFIITEYKEKNIANV